MTHPTQTMIDIETALNAVNYGSWEDLEAGLNVLDACLRELGFDQGAIDAVQGEISNSLYVQDEVWLRICEPAMYCPTQSTGYGNYYYWSRCGNAWKDANSVDLGEGFYANSIKLALVDADRLQAESHHPVCYRIRPNSTFCQGVIHRPSLKVWKVDEKLYLSPAEALAAVGGPEKAFEAALAHIDAHVVEWGQIGTLIFSRNPIAHYGIRGVQPILPAFMKYEMGSGEEKDRIFVYENAVEVADAWHQWTNEVGLDTPRMGVVLPESWWQAGMLAMTHWATNVVMTGKKESPEGGIWAYWAGIVAAQEGKETEEAPKLGALLQQVDDYLSDRSVRPTQAELRREVRQALGQKA